MTKWAFLGASSSNQDLGGWNTGNVLNMEGMFQASSFNQDLYRWSVHRVTSRGIMFLSGFFRGAASMISLRWGREQSLMVFLFFLTQG